MKPEEKANDLKELKKPSRFKVKIVKEGDTPNIYIRNKSDDSLYAKIWIMPDGKLEIMRFQKDGRAVGFFIDKNGKDVSKVEFEETMVDAPREVIED